MNLKIFIGILLGAFVAGCSVSSDNPVPQADIGQNVTPHNAGWSPFQSNSHPQSEPQPTPVKDWRGNSAWGYPPAPSSVSPSVHGKASAPEAQAIDSDLVAKPVIDEPEAVTSSSVEPDVERAPLPAVQDTSVAVGDAAPNSWMNVSSSRSLWVDKHVPATMREVFGDAANQAATEGSATVVDPESGHHYSMSRVWKVGKCSGLEVSMLSPGGKLPVISRGSTEVCS